MNKISWNPVKIAIKNIRTWEKNPRKSSVAQSKKLVESENRFGQVQTIAVSPFYPDGTVDLYDGHQRVKAWLTVKGNSYEMLALQCDSHLSEEQRKDLAVTLHTATGSWDVDALKSHWNMEQLSEAFFPQVEIMKIEYEDIQSIFSSYTLDDENGKSETGSQDSDNPYSKLIKQPHYEPTGNKPSISDLYNDTKTKELVSAITESDLSEDEKVFLIKAAQRHTVFNFKNIAEYYSHSDKRTQQLMEDSALVIIDFDSAIRNGFIILSKEIAELYAQDYKNE